MLALPLTMGLVSCSDGLDALLLSSLMGDSSGFFSGDYYEDYDLSGIPIYGYDGGQAVYGYDSSYQPIYSPNRLSNAAYVPGWAPRSGARVNYPARAQRSWQPPRNAKHRHAGPNGLRGSSRRVHHTAPRNDHRNGASHNSRNDHYDFSAPSNRNDRFGRNDHSGRNDRHGFNSPADRNNHFDRNNHGGRNERHGFNSSFGRDSRFGGGMGGGNQHGGKTAAPAGRGNNTHGKSDNNRPGLKGRR